MDNTKKSDNKVEGAERGSAINKILAHPQVIWIAISMIYGSLLLYTAYYTFLSNNEYATDPERLSIVLGNIGYNQQEKSDIAEHIKVLLNTNQEINEDYIKARLGNSELRTKLSPYEKNIINLAEGLKRITGESSLAKAIDNMGLLIAANKQLDLYEEAQLDSIVALALDFSKQNDFENEGLKGRLWFTDKDGETKVHLIDMKRSFAQRLVRRESSSFQEVNNLATQSFTIVLGAILGFLSASLLEVD
ncbi:MAG: hypothetical protein HRT88_22535 [Lentisphaeraceae bacterium]|nr:hypothetical protein [Lentisphaeraceae bacterium]